MDCIFCKIVNREIPAKIVYEDEYVIAFPDIHPLNKIHLLIIPKKHIDDLLVLSAEDEKYVTRILSAIKKLAKENGLDKKGYRVQLNGGGAQLVPHLHFHLRGPISRDAAM